mgnify:CR=1 FL=1
MSQQTFNYQGYLGSHEISVEDGCLYGEILFIKDTVTYQADTVTELEKEFQSAVDDYLQLCTEIGKEPQRPFKGTLNVRLTPLLHRSLAHRAAIDGLSVNETIKHAV